MTSLSASQNVLNFIALISGTALEFAADVHISLKSVRINSWLKVTHCGRGA
jgi:hypothetical protein